MSSTLGRFFQQLHRAIQGQGPRDSELLQRFVEERDASAFESLLRRHGPMVLGVCLRVLKNEQDAYDAFQACFIVLLRKASSIRSPAALASWLFGVAQRTAMEARKSAARRRAKESRVMPRADQDGRDEELREVLDQALARLPEKYRLAVVLCDLEDRSRRAAAHELGVAEGTVASRLARGRMLLAAHLKKRGVVVSGAVLALALGESTMAAVPASLAKATLGSVSSLMGGQAAGVPTHIAALAERTLRSLGASRARSLLTWVAVALLTMGGGVSLASYLQTTESSTENASTAATAKPDNRPRRPPDTWELDFEEGLPKDFPDGEFMGEKLPAGSRGGVRAVSRDRGAEGTYFMIRTARDPDGLFAVHEDSHFHCTFKMDAPDWLNIFLIAFNADGSHASNYLFNKVGPVKPGRWYTLTIPVSHFKRLTVDGAAPWQGDLPGVVLFSSLAPDRGLVVDRLWVSRGGPGKVLHQPVN